MLEITPIGRHSLHTFLRCTTSQLFPTKPSLRPNDKKINQKIYSCATPLKNMKKDSHFWSAVIARRQRKGLISIGERVCPMLAEGPFRTYNRVVSHARERESHQAAADRG